MWILLGFIALFMAFGGLAAIIKPPAPKPGQKPTTRKDAVIGTVFFGFLAEEFRVPYKLAADRLNQIRRRIFQARFDIQFAQYLHEEEQKINGKTISYKIED